MGKRHNPYTAQGTGTCTHHTHTSLYLVFCAALLLLAACDSPVTPPSPTPLYHHYHSTDPLHWQASDTLTFIIPAQQPAAQNYPAHHTPSTGQLHDATIAVRLLETYPYRKLRLSVNVQELLPRILRVTIHNTLNPDSTILRSDTTARIIQPVRNIRNTVVQFTPFDERDLPQQATTLPHICLEQADSPLILNPHHDYRISISHQMRQTTLSGITEVGLRLTTRH